MEKNNKKIVYSKKVQDKIYNIAKKIIKDIISKNTKIYLVNCFGSLVRREMGLYNGVYDNKRYGSDVDIVCVVDPKFKVPRKWKFIGKAKAFDVYDVDNIEKYMPKLGKKELPIHPIKFLLFNPKVHEYNEAKKWSGIDRKYSESLGFPVENWFINKKELNGVMKNIVL